MKKLLLSVLLVSSAVFANPFDSFVGEYRTVSSPRITSLGSYRCIWFDFEKIIGFELRQDTQGYKQTHSYKIIKSDGWSGYPISEFQWSNENATGGSYAKTSGAASSAVNEYGSYSSNSKETLTVSLQKIGILTTLNVEHTRYDKNIRTWGCTYSVDLQLR